MKKPWNSKKAVALRHAMLAAVSPREMYEIVEMQKFLALQGDTNAAEFVCNYTVGRPASMVELIAIESMTERFIDSEEIEAQKQLMYESVPPLLDGEPDELPPPISVEFTHDEDNETECA